MTDALQAVHRTGGEWQAADLACALVYKGEATMVSVQSTAVCLKRTSLRLASLVEWRVERTS